MDQAQKDRLKAYLNRDIYTLTQAELDDYESLLDIHQAEIRFHRPEDE